MDKNKIVGLAIIVAGVAAIMFLVNTRNQPQEVDVLSESLANPVTETAEKIHITSDSCKLTDGKDARRYCVGTDNVDPEIGPVPENLAQVRACAIHAISRVNGYPLDKISEDEVLELLCAIAEYYPDKGEDLNSLDLSVGMYHLLNDFVNK